MTDSLCRLPARLPDNVCAGHFLDGELPAIVDRRMWVEGAVAAAGKGCAERTIL